MDTKQLSDFAPLWELNPLWQTLTEEERQRIIMRGKIVSYSKNDIIHHDGEQSVSMWMLLKGKVRIYKEGIGQRQQIIRRSTTVNRYVRSHFDAIFHARCFRAPAREGSPIGGASRLGEP